MIYLLILTHWIADFICQTDNMARNKSKSNIWLGKHILAYMGILFIFTVYAGWYLPKILTFLFVLTNGAVHFVIDYFTSRQTSKLWAKGEVHNFFVVVGFDQAHHMITLIYTFNLFIGKA